MNDFNQITRAKNKEIEQLRVADSKDTLLGYLLFDELKTALPLVISVGKEVSTMLAFEVKGVLLYHSNQRFYLLKNSGSRLTETYRLWAVPLFINLVIKLNQAVIRSENFDDLFFTLGLGYLPWAGIASPDQSGFPAKGKTWGYELAAGVQKQILLRWSFVSHIGFQSILVPEIKNKQQKNLYISNNSLIFSELPISGSQLFSLDFGGLTLSLGLEYRFW